MDNRAGIGRDGKETNIGYKGQEDVESHDLLHPKKTIDKGRRACVMKC